MNRRDAGRWFAGTLAAALTLTASVSTSAALAQPGELPADRGQKKDRVEIDAVSNTRPEYVSGGDVMVRVTLPDGIDADDLRVERNGVDVTSAFRLQRDKTLLGVVDGLRLGKNTIEVRRDRDGRGGSFGRSARLTVNNHRISGPVFSGLRQLPFYCQTEAFGLAPAQQPLCSAPTRVSYQYRTTAGRFAPLSDPSSPPSDVATATVGGRVVPYIVRIERGTIDRAVYEIAGLYDGGAPDPVGTDRGWNRRLVYTFGGGCNGGYHQGASTGGVLDDLFLSQGYVVASSSLNVLNNNCSPIISAEAAMMVKEHAIETYGPPEHTIGWGGSGGAIQQYDIADSYPGILDGILPAISFPDPLTTLGPVVDCRLMNDYFDNTDLTYTRQQQVAIEGFGFVEVCRSWDATFANRVTATDSCDPAIPVAARWDPETNPDGVKCAAIEQFVTQLGRNPKTGFVRSPLDNVGVQYGLDALHAGDIDAERFVDLNERIGGVDIAGELQDGRSIADRRALISSYRNNLVNSGGQGLATTAVIDLRRYLDDRPVGGGNIHTAEWSYVMRQRMIEQGTVDNQVILEHAPQFAADASTYALDAMDRWLTNIGGDDRRGSLQDKVARNRPSDLADGCYLADGTRIREPLSYGGGGRCAKLYPIYSNTRLAAGEPLTRDVLKCSLTPMRFGDYPVTFTRAQKSRLLAAFPDGVCNFDRRGVGQRSPAGAWLDYGDGGKDRRRHGDIKHC